MNNLFEGMKEKNRDIYEKMWGDFDFGSLNAEIKRTNSEKNKEGSKDSYCFCGEKDKKQILVDAFGLEKNRVIFSDKYNMAVCGSGKEEEKITTLISSSLCALLHFYNVTKDNKLILEFNTNKGGRKVEFYESFFEYMNPVFNKPSNMDIVLLGKEGEEDIILFLESKFSEFYLGAGNEYEKSISKKYIKNGNYSEPLYRDDFLKEIGLKRMEDKEGNFKLKSLQGQFYIEGIKQLISHYVGVMNVLNGKLYKGPKPCMHKRVDEAIKNSKTKAILGEIIFDYRIGDLKFDPDDNYDCAGIYKEKYEKLADRIATLQDNNDRFEIIMNTLSYSVFKDNKHKLEPEIRKYYRY